MNTIHQTDMITFHPDTLHVLRRPRIIDFSDGTIDASKVCHVSQIKEYGLGSYSFHVHTESEAEVNFNSSDLSKLQAIRRRLVDFIWPNADMFDPSKNDAAS